MRRSVTIVLCGALLTLACRGAGGEERVRLDSEARREVLARLDGYTAAARAVDADASASFFSANGTLFEPGIVPIISRDSIRAFVRSFPGVTVDSATATADTVEVYGSTAIVWGSYFERLHFPGQPESAQHGRFVMKWGREGDGVWRIERYYRIPLPEGWQPPTVPDGRTP